MQVFSIIDAIHPYDVAMQKGRPSTRQRSPFGQRVHAARLAIGLSQAEVAEKVGITQSGYASWERDAVALRPEQLLKLTDILQVSVEHLLGVKESPKRGSGPTGRLRRLFEEASKLPRNQQEKVFSILQPFVTQHSGKAA